MKLASKFLSICIGITMVMCSISLFLFSVKPSYAETPIMSFQNEMNPVENSRPRENFVPIVIHNDYAYWIVFTQQKGYRYRKSRISGSHWEKKGDE